MRPTKADREPFYTTALRALIYGIAAALLLLRLALPSGIVSGMAGVMIAVTAAHVATRLRVRLPVVLCAGAAAIILGLAGNWIITHPDTPAQLLGVQGALTLADIVVFGLCAFGIVLAVRMVATRVSALALVEVVAITGVVVALVAGHRDQMISEPRFLSDWAWSQGGDPMLVLMGLGGLTLATVPLLLLVKQRMLKAAMSISALLFLGLIVFLLLQVDPPKPPPPKDTMGLAGGV